MGKSQLSRELSHHLLQEGESIGILALEENVKRTALGLMSITANLPLHDSLDDLGQPKEYPESMLRDAFDQTLGSGRVRIYDHFGSTDVKNLLQKIRFMVKGFGCTYIILDHISIVVSGIDGGDERRIIDNLMTSLRTLTEELGCGMILVTHLKRPGGDKGHEDGVETSLSHLRGSAAIAQLSDTVIGIERNQQCEQHPNIATLRVLKNRFLGMTGKAGHLEYQPTTGRMVEITEAEYNTLMGEDSLFKDESIGDY
jgi:twinkle protein